MSDEVALLSSDTSQRLGDLVERIEKGRASGDPRVGDTAAGLAAIYIRECARDGDEAGLKKLAVWLRDRVGRRMMHRALTGALTN